MLTESLISDLFRFLPEFFFFGMMILAPFFQIFHTIQSKSVSNLSPWTSISFFIAGIGLLASQAYYAYSFLSYDGFIPKGALFFMSIAIIFIIENALMVHLILKYKNKNR